MPPLTNRPSARRHFLFSSLLLALLLAAAAGLTGPARKAAAVSPVSGPGFTAKDQQFTLTSAGVASQNPVPAQAAGGLIAYVEQDGCDHVLKLKTDPDQVNSLLGAPVPAAGYELLRRESDGALPTCQPSSATQPEIDAVSGGFTMGAYDLSATTRRVVIAYQRSEGGCAFTGGGSCCTQGAGATDLNGDGDYFDQVLHYAELTIDKPTKAVTNIQSSVNTGAVLGGTQLFLTNGKFIAGTTDESALAGWSCSAGGSCGGGQQACVKTSDGEDLNGDGFTGGAEVVRLYDVDTNTTTNTGLGLGESVCAAPMPQYQDVAFEGVSVRAVMGDQLLAFLTRESPGRAGGSGCSALSSRDLNGDGDTSDLVVRAIQLGGPLTSVFVGPTISQNTENLTGPGSTSANAEAVLHGTDGQKIAYSVMEAPFVPSPPCNDPADLNANCQQDASLQLYDASAGTNTNVGVSTTAETFLLGPFQNSKFRGGIAAFLTNESQEGASGTDFNCDGDTADRVLRFLKLSTGEVINTHVAARDIDGPTTTSQKALVGTDGDMILFEDVPPTAPASPIDRLFYVEAGEGTTVPACGADADDDGVADADDQCPGTPSGTTVQTSGNGAGCPLDSFVVNTTADTNDGACTAPGTGNGCTLREAINAANAAADFNTIRFDIAGAGVKTIAPTSALPTITQPVAIDGSTQPGYAGTPVIELNGAGAGAGVNGLSITAGSSTVKALVINRFLSRGINLQNGGGNTVVGCYIGTDATGSVDLGNAVDGIRIHTGSTGNVIGGLTSTPGAGAGNVISGNGNNGIEINTGVNGNVVRGNIVGLNAAGTADLGNSSNGVITLSASTTIGGSTAQARNIISGNDSDGVELNGAAADNNTVAGNFIGTDITGNVDLGNTIAGVVIGSGAGSQNNTIGGSAATAGAAPGNVISGNNGSGVSIPSAGTTGNLIRGNLIGLNAAGTADLGNTLDGVNIASASSNTVGGLTSTPGTGLGNVISGNNSDGVEMSVANSNTVLGNLIGTNAAGTGILRNEDSGVLLSNAAVNTIGGPTNQARNVISGHNQAGTDAGIKIVGESADGNVIQGNYVGTDITGSLDFGNAQGVTISQGDTTTVGGSTATPGQAPGNVISASGVFGNGSDNIEVTFDVSGLQISGNLIGLNAQGTAALGNFGCGILVTDTDNIHIGGAASNMRNVISGNTFGIQLGDSVVGNAVTNSIVQGNYIGTDINGTADLGNGTGVFIQRGGSILVGGSTPTTGTAPGNVISGNDVGINGGTTNTSLSIKGNIIGLNGAGTAALGNSSDAIQMAAPATTIGGTTPGERNVISGNNGGAIQLNLSVNSLVLGNYIGTDINGTAPFPNTYGVLMASGANNNRIGGTAAGEANVIAFNRNDGVHVQSGATGNRILGNSIHTNGNSFSPSAHIGIDLNSNGVTLNDAGDADAGANNLQNFPVIGSASTAGSVAGTLNSTPGQTFTIHFYSNPACHASGYGEGRTYLGALTTAATDAGGNTAFAFSGPALAAGQVVTATATDAAGNTSEFSLCRNVTADADGDGRPDGSDNCPNVSNPDQLDTDADGQGDACDPDDDNDGAADGADNCPLTSNPTQANNDGDAQGDACDPDDDNDTVADVGDNCPLTSNAAQTNTDGDAQGDACDPDDDNDGVSDAADNCPLTSNPDQANFDGDALGDACDPDDDNDGVLDGADLCPHTPAGAQVNAAGCPDADGDGVADTADNCPTVSNPDQANHDGDAQGDTCDADDDNDGFSDVTETGAGSDPLNAASTPEVCDGVDNDLNDGADEGFANTDGDAQADCVDTDDDGDGFSDTAETTAGSDPLNANSTPEVCDGVDNDLNEGVDEGFPNTDGDGRADCVDDDDDNDGQSDADEVACGSDPLSAASRATDTDGDGQPDCVDTDDDNDGVSDGTDNCQLASNPDQANNDGDALGDACDPDDDNDGAPDGVDNCPLSPNPDQADADGDGQGDACDTDDDNDGVPDGGDNCPLVQNAGQSDIDHDGQGDACDTDDDNDGVADNVDQCPGTPSGVQVNAAGCQDSDGDGAADAVDNCPAVPNPDQANHDSDQQGDACDADDDGDGFDDTTEAAAGSDPLDAASTPEVCDGADNDLDGLTDEGSADTDGDGRADCVDADDDNDGQLDADESACGSDPADAGSKSPDADGDGRPDCVDSDDDGDGVPDSSDNCARTSNGDQSDADHDGVGDVCDADVDGDGVIDTGDNCPLHANADQLDTDHDGVGNACDSDDDGDGVADATDTCPLTANPTQADNDGDGLGDACDLDDDNDGVPDLSDNCPLTANPTQADSDHDGVGDACDQAVAFSVCPLYDQTKVNKAGSTIPVKLRLCDSAGNNLSSAGVTVFAVGIRKVSETTYGAATDSGQANPDGNFRYDPTLGGPGGGYIFNLSTRGLTTGTYELGFRAGSDATVYTVRFQIK